MSLRRHRVVVVGAGFGGLAATKALAESPLDVTLVDARNHHTFQPLLYQVATAGLDGDDICFPVRGIFGRQDNARGAAPGSGRALCDPASARSSARGPGYQRGE